MHRAAILECDFEDIYGSVEFTSWNADIRGHFAAKWHKYLRCDGTQQNCTLQQKKKGPCIASGQ